MLAVLVLDGLHPPLLDRLLAEGRLPAMAGLIESGQRIPLECSSEYLEGSTHTTMHTGVEASTHGIHTPFQWSAPDQRVRPRDRFEVPPAIWDRLGAASRRSLLIDPYDTIAPQAMLGTAVRGWQFTNRVALPPWSTDGARRRLSRRFGRPRPADEIFGRPDPRELLRIREILLEAPDRIARAAETLLAEGEFDLLWIDFAAMHMASHQFLDVDAVTSTDGLDADERARLHSAMEDVYVAGDGAIGRVLELLPPGTDVVAPAPSTMVAERDRSDMLPAMVARVLGEETEEQAEPGRLQLWRLRAAVPTPIRSRLARMIPDGIALRMTSRLLTAGGDWSTVRVFPVPNDPCGGIRVNLLGRERDGIVDPAKADEVLDEVAAGLETFRDADGAASVESVDRVADLERPGPLQSQLPDLVVRWRPVASAGVTAVHSERFGSVERHGVGSGRSGNHTGGAWAILAPGSSRARELDRPARLVDVAATAASLLGADTDGLAGEPLLEASPASR